MLYEVITPSAAGRDRTSAAAQGVSTTTSSPGRGGRNRAPLGSSKRSLRSVQPRLPPGRGLRRRDLPGPAADGVITSYSIHYTKLYDPYPPGFPILVPGQVISEAIIEFLRKLDVKEIHGYRPELGLRVFTEDALKQRLA